MPATTSQTSHGFAQGCEGSAPGEVGWGTTMTNDQLTWSYGGDSGPEAWGSIDPSFSQCAVGRMQSPIDLSVAERGERGDLALSYHFNSLTFAAKRAMVVITADPGGMMSYLGGQYEFSELHFHAPAEHTIGDDRPDLEGHFVHIGPGRSMAVVAVLFDTVHGIHPVDQLISTLPETDDVVTVVRLVDIQSVIPLASPRYRYQGSLTRPPCTEEVEWIVMRDRQPVGAAALDAFAQRLAPNNRPIQPLNDRAVTLG